MPQSDQRPVPTSHFTRDVLTLVTGTTISQLLMLLFAPVITRFYGPEAFGLLAIFTSVTSVLGVIICLRYELAIMLPKMDEEGANVFGLCILIAFAISILSIPVLIFSYDFLSRILNSSQIGNYLWLIPPSILLSGTFLALNYWNTRTRQFHRLAITQVVRSFSITGAQVGCGFAGYVSGGILIGTSVIGQLVATVALAFLIMRDHLSFFRNHITMNGIIAVFWRYSKFPLYSTWAALLNTITLMMPVFVLTAYFSPTVVGYYSLGLMVLQFPLSLIGGAITQVFFQKAAEAKNISHEILKEAVKQTIKPLIFATFLPVILFILIGPEIFGVVFGVGWEEAGNYVRFLSIWVGLGFIASPISNLFSIFEKQHVTVLITLLELIFPLGAIIIGAHTGIPLNAIILFSIVAFVTNIVAYAYLLGLAEISILVPAKIISNFFILSMPFVLCILAIKSLFSSDILIVFLSVMVSLMFPLMVIKRDAEISDLFKSVTASIPVINHIAKYLR